MKSVADHAPKQEGDDWGHGKSRHISYDAEKPVGRVGAVKINGQNLGGNHKDSHKNRELEKKPLSLIDYITFMDDVDHNQQCKDVDRGDNYVEFPHDTLRIKIPNISTVIDFILPNNGYFVICFSYKPKIFAAWGQPDRLDPPKPFYKWNCWSEAEKKTAPVQGRSVKTLISNIPCTGKPLQ